MKTHESRTSEPIKENRRRGIGLALGAFATTALAIGANFFMAAHSFADGPAKAKPTSNASAPLRQAAAKPAPEASGNAAASVIVPTIEAANPLSEQNLEIVGFVGGIGAASLGLAFAGARRSQRANQAPHDKSLTNELGLRTINVQEPIDELWRPDADVVAVALEAGVTEDTMSGLELAGDVNSIFDAHYREAHARIAERQKAEAALIALAPMFAEIDAQCAEALAMPQPTLAGVSA